MPATQPLLHYASGRATAHTGLTLCYPAHKPRCTAKSERTDRISSRRLATPLLQSLSGCLSVAEPHSKLTATRHNTPLRLSASAEPPLPARRSKAATLRLQRYIRAHSDFTVHRLITSAKAERAVAHTHTKSPKRLCDAHGESSPHNGGRGERHGGGIFRDARKQGKGRLSAGRWGVFTDSS